MPRTREQRAEDFCKDLQPWLNILETVKDAGDKLYRECGAGTPEGEYLEAVLDSLDDVVTTARDTLYDVAKDIKTGALDVPTYVQPKRDYPGMDDAS